MKSESNFFVGNSMIVDGPTELVAAQEPLQWGIHVDVSRKLKGNFLPALSFFLSIPLKEKSQLGSVASNWRIIVLSFHGNMDPGGLTLQMDWRLAIF
jgi:hypothetical protein